MTILGALYLLQLEKKPFRVPTYDELMAGCCQRCDTVPGTSITYLIEPNRAQVNLHTGKNQMAKQFNTFEQWAASEAQPTPAPEPPPDIMPLDDALTKWKADAEERDRQRAAAKAELRKTEQRSLVKTNDVDWAVILKSIADGFDGLRKRVEFLEAALLETDTQVLLELPLHLQPKHGPGAEMPIEANMRFSPPLLTKGAKSKAANATRRRIVQLSENVEKRLAQLDHTLAEQTKMQKEIEAIRAQCSALQQSAQLTRDRLADCKADITALRMAKPAPTDPPIHYHINHE